MYRTLNTCFSFRLILIYVLAIFILNLIVTVQLLTSILPEYNLHKVNVYKQNNIGLKFDHFNWNSLISKIMNKSNNGKNDIRKRVSVKLKRPNPLFEKWLKEWYDEAAMKKNVNRQHAFRLALKSLKQYPLPLQTGRECKILNGFGNIICSMLDKKLQTLEQNSPSSASSTNSKQSEQVQSSEGSNIIDKNTVIAASTTINCSTYKPKFKSEPCAILICLQQFNATDGLSKAILKEKSQIFCKSRVKCTTFIQELLEANLISKTSKPVRYFLTENGKQVAHRLFQEHKEKICKLVSNNVVESTVTCSSQNQHEQHLTVDQTQEAFILEPHTFDICLIIDNKEVSALKTSAEDEIVYRLIQLGVNYEIRNLKIGDFAFVCREKSSNHNELVLPYVIERKRIDDFGASIKDGRFHEQKFRLKQSGIPNLIYLVEMFDTSHTGLPMQTLYQAAINTLVQDKFSVKFTYDIPGTTNYLFTLYTILKDIYLSKTLVHCLKENLPTLNINDNRVSLMSFTEFNKNSNKTKPMTVTDMFIKHLLQVKGLSIDKVLAIIERYKTPKQLKQALDMYGEDAVALQFGTLKKNFGPVIRRILCMLYTKETF